MEINVPSLRERPDDVPLLCEHLMAKIRKEMDQGPTRVSDQAMEVLKAHNWPGNVRELENALLRAAIVARGPVIGPDHLSLGPALGAAAPATPTGGPGDQTLDEVIHAHVVAVLRSADGNKSEAARLLGVSRSRLEGYVKKFEL